MPPLNNNPLWRRRGRKDEIGVGTNIIRKLPRNWKFLPTNEQSSKTLLEVVWHTRLQSRLWMTSSIFDIPKIRRQKQLLLFNAIHQTQCEMAKWETQKVDRRTPIEYFESNLSLSTVRFRVYFVTVVTYAKMVTPLSLEFALTLHTKCTVSQPNRLSRSLLMRNWTVSEFLNCLKETETRFAHVRLTGNAASSLYPSLAVALTQQPLQTYKLLRWRVSPHFVCFWAIWRFCHSLKFLQISRQMTS